MKVKNISNTTIVSLQKDTVAIICDQSSLISCGPSIDNRGIYMLNSEKLIEFDDIQKYKKVVDNFDYSKQKIFNKEDSVIGFELEAV